MTSGINRRDFLKDASVGAALVGTAIHPRLRRSCAAEPATDKSAPQPLSRTSYAGPKAIVIRFGGGVRRQETIDTTGTYSPFLCHELTQRGTLFKNMVISTDAPETSHGEGTLNILTGIYDRYKDVGNKFLGARFEARVPTIFEYLRKSFLVLEHETLIINGEDRTDEEFYTFSNHHLFGVNYRSTVLSLYRFKTFLLRQQIESGQFVDDMLESKQKELAEMEALDYRRQSGKDNAPQITEFWKRWRGYYGDSGLKNPRGDRLLTELALWSLKHLRPKLMMVNYNDSDYVHWGNMTHYTQGIAIMDRGVRQLLEAVAADEVYRDNTVFAIVPDCGRDSNPFMSVPCQHHFNTASARKIFGFFLGAGIDRGRVVDREVEQNMVAATIGQLMGFHPEFAEGGVLEEAIA